MVHALPSTQSLRAVVYVVDDDALHTVLSRVTQGHPARLVFRDQDGVQLLRHEPAEEGGASVPTGEPVFSPQQAMLARLDFESSRLLTSETTALGGAVSVSVGIAEREALREYRERYAATWRIVGFGVGAWLMLALFVVAALFNFKRTERYLRSLATTDALTELPNRRSFHALLENAVGRALGDRRRGVALYFIDVDHFKEINDTAGHAAGDALLKQMAARLRQAARKEDVVCRLAGDEFTVIAPGVTSAEQATALGERLLAQCESLFSCDETEYRIHLSAGVALLPSQASNASQLMQFADTALYRAKDAGRARCLVYDSAMTKEDLKRNQTLADLDKALERGNDELYLVYQPKYHLASGALTGHEALIRWRHPLRGVVSPGEFIALAESSGLIGRLGDWVLHRAVRQIRRWADDGQGWHPVAVNVSALQLTGTHLAQYIASLLGEYRVPGRFLQVELTESSLAANAETARGLIRQLRGLGVSVAIDDFGTGFSCLSMLGEFEIDCLKVDRSFVNRLTTSQGRSICRAVVSLGQSLGATVVAEGVETPEQAQILADLGCNEVQGYLFAKPQDPQDAAQRRQATAYVPETPDGARASTNSSVCVELPRAA